MARSEHIDRNRKPLASVSLANTAALVGLSFVNGIGPKMFEKLVDRFDSPEEILNASVDELCKIPRLTSKIAEAIRVIDLEAVETELIALEEFGITVVTRYDKSYPQNLKTISDAPPVLFQTGDFQDNDSRAVAVVGTRQPSQRGRKIARELAYGLAERGFTIVSGLALGIDTAAHQGALQIGGRTIAVLGSGIKIIHPNQNQGLADEIRRSGAIFSELHPNTRPAAGTLMSRDRIISGLALGTIIVEANENSGSMDTAKRTRIQGRKLFAVAAHPCPSKGGEANENKGNRKLINEGAYPIADVTQASLDQISEILTAKDMKMPDDNNQMSLF